MVKHLTTSKGVRANCTSQKSLNVPCAHKPIHKVLFNDYSTKSVSKQSRRAATKLLRLKSYTNSVHEKNSKTIYRASSLFGQIVLSCEGDRLVSHFMKSDCFNYRVLKTPYTGSAEIIRRALWTITAQKHRTAPL
jgi:hypothetical protein